MFVGFFLGMLQVQAQYTNYVNPFIGTGSHGHTFPGATLPFGMVQASPDTRIDGSWDGCSGYHYSDSIIYGFSHTHLSGTGVSDFGDISLMPGLGKFNFDETTNAATFSHEKEKAEPGYYSVYLNNKQIQADITATTRVALHQYSFPRIGPVNIILDLQHRDELRDFEIRIVSKNKIVGHRRSKGWANDQLVYFTIEFSQPFIRSAFHENKSKAGFLFLLRSKDPLLVKVALSFATQSGADENMQSELPGWNFDSTRSAALQAWNRELGKIAIISPQNEENVKFYTALYHGMTHPNVCSDVNGDYYGMDHKVHKAIGYQRYSVFSIWDTYRALHPLLTIIDQKRSLDFIRTFLAMYQEIGRLPVWELGACETDCMIGYHAASIITDAWAKGIRGFDSTLALEAMISIANENRLGKREYIKFGFIPSEKEPESVSKTLEYAYDDWCISEFARLIGNKEIEQEYRQRSTQWRNIFDPETGFMRPKYNGNWLEPFDPREVNNHYTEANGWQYSLYVPHDIREHIMALGGLTEFAQLLDGMFADSSGTTGRDQADITGLIGQYAHGNEPSHHIAYLYNYVFQPWKTQDIVHEICTDFYSTEPDGLIGNEDCGQMSAWYVLSALGMYQVTPGNPSYSLGVPALDNATINLENGNKIQIKTTRREAGSHYAVSKINGEVVGFVGYDQLQSGCEILFNMSAAPADNASDYLLPPFSTEIVQNPTPPLIDIPRSFKGSAKAVLRNQNDADRMLYYLNGDSLNTFLYTGPIEIRDNASIHAFSVKYDGVSTLRSKVSESITHRIYNDWKVDLQTAYNHQYSAGGAGALVDGIYGSTNWRAGDWQGYQNTDLEAIIDLGSVISVSEISGHFLQDERSWILYPTVFTVFISTDGTNWVEVGSSKNTISPQDPEVQTKFISVKLKNSRSTKYVKVVAHNFGKLPSWHQGHGADGQAFIFVDEIEIR